MPSQPPDIPAIRSLLLDQIFSAFARSLPRWLRFLLTPIFWPVAHKFARLLFQFDAQIAENGIQKAAGWILDHFVDSTRTSGIDHIPPAGPLLIAGNHPGAYDIFAQVSSLPRTDFRVIVSDEKLYRTLPHLHPYLIYVTHDPHNRMAAVRLMLEQLRQGSAIIIFPTGRVDPDPAFLPGALEELDRWSSSLEILLRKVPETCLVVAITSGVLSPKILGHPITHLPHEPWQQRKLAEFIQVMLQFAFGMKFRLSPCISFSQGQQIGLSSHAKSREELQLAVHQQALTAMADHMQVFYHASTS